jgi:DNA polymerase III epsilon subunit-like protein
MIIFDLETTGLLKPELAELGLQPYMTEFYGIKVTREFEFVEEFGSLVKPPVPIPEEITKITGIDDEMLKNAPSFLELIEDISNFFLGEVDLIGHNVMFDRNVLRWELTRHDLEFKFPWPRNQICTVELSKPIKNKRLTLSALHELATGSKFDGAHRAKMDVMALVRCFEWLVEEGYYKFSDGR